jgi:hypothetical protein
MNGFWSGSVGLPENTTLPSTFGIRPCQQQTRAQQRRLSRIVTMIGQQLCAPTQTIRRDLVGGTDVVVSAWLSNPLGAAALARKWREDTVFAYMQLHEHAAIKVVVCKLTTDSSFVAFVIHVE